VTDNRGQYELRDIDWVSDTQLHRAETIESVTASVRDLLNEFQLTEVVIRDVAINWPTVTLVFAYMDDAVTFGVYYYGDEGEDDFHDALVTVVEETA
jgi:hypothetical protein